MKWRCKLCRKVSDTETESYIRELRIDTYSGEELLGAACFQCCTQLAESGKIIKDSIDDVRRYGPYVHKREKCQVLRFHLKRPSNLCLAQTMSIPTDVCGIIVQYYSPEYDYMIIREVDPDVVQSILSMLYHATDASTTDWIDYNADLTPQELYDALAIKKNVSTELDVESFYQYFQDDMCFEFNNYTEHIFEWPPWNPLNHLKAIEIEASIKHITEKQIRKRQRLEYFISQSNELLKKKRIRLEEMQNDKSVSEDQLFYQWQE